MLRTVLWCWLAALLPLAVSCASLEVLPADDPHRDEGVVFYPPKLYCSISEVETEDGSKSAKAEILSLPDYAHPRRVTWSGGLFGSVAPKVTLTNGWMLGSLEGEVASGFSGAMSAIEDLAGLHTPGLGPVIPGIYPLEWDADRQQFTVIWDRPLLQFRKQ